MRNRILIIAGLLIMLGCSKKAKHDTDNVTPTVPDPVKATLEAPAQNEVCLTGAIVSATESKVTFTWSATSNTDSYDLVLKNLLTSAISTQTTSSANLELTLSRNTPYSWYIISKSTKTTAKAQSDTWRFYNAGSGTITYSPFPTEIISPLYAASVTQTSGTINLSWKGSSVNPGTIVAYDVYFGTVTSPPLLKSGISDAFLNNVSVAANTTYYWKVITKDIIGNTSDSGIYMFKVN